MSLPILPTISTAFIVLSAITVAIGWYQIKQRKSRNTSKDDDMWQLYLL